MNGKPADSDYLYTSEDTVKVSNGDTTLTESDDLSEGIRQVRVILDGSTIQ